jgi:hypothetical protein
MGCKDKIFVVVAAIVVTAVSYGITYGITWVYSNVAMLHTWDSYALNGLLTLAIICAFCDGDFYQQMAQRSCMSAFILVLFAACSGIFTNVSVIWLPSSQAGAVFTISFAYACAKKECNDTPEGLNCFLRCIMRIKPSDKQGGMDEVH